MKPTISIIVAKAKNDVIGKDNKMPWHLPADLKHFKNLTYGHHIIMGRKTFESIGKPLPGRTSIIITTQKDLTYDFDNVKIVHSFDEALNESFDEKEVFVTGGSMIYQIALPVADKIYMTLIDAEPEGDTYFPELEMDYWDITQQEEHEANEKNPHNYKFLTLERKQFEQTAF